MKKLFGQKCLLSILVVAGIMAFGAEMHAKDGSRSYKIDHEIIRMLDGKSWGINGEVIGVMFQVIFNIRKMLYGALDRVTKTHVGLYSFNGGKHSIISLAQIESQLNASFFAQEKILIDSMDPQDLAKLDKIKQDYVAKRAELNQIMLKIKDEFKCATATYVEAARGFKEQMLLLITESCRLRGKEKCFLLKWGEAQEGRETEYFDNDITTCAEMAVFFGDLIHFLEDLVNSCEKGHEQLKQMMEKSKDTRKKHS